MLTARLCLVLGAGASRPYGFLTGGELLHKVCATQPDEWWPLAKAAIGAGRDTHEEFVEALRSAGSASIDHFVGKQPYFKEYAKALIAYYIGQAEQSKAIVGADPNFDWQRYLIQRIVDGMIELDEVARSPLSVVTFNFDRSFEEAMLLRLTHLHRRPREAIDETRRRAASVVLRWPIVHVHGSLGTLPELVPDGTAGRPYAQSLDPGELRKAIDRIILLDDAAPDSEEFTSARGLIRDADIVLYLGFAFHRVNCQRVLPKDWRSDHPNSHFATIKDMASGAVAKAAAHFTPHRSLSTHAMDCLSLLRTLEDRFSD